MPARFLLLWLLLVAIALAWGLGSVPLLDADEGRNAEVGREMSVTNDYLVPRLDGLPYLDKPVVYFAAEAAAMEVLGPTELAARLPAYLFTLATAAIVFWLARRLFDERTAWTASIVFLAMPLTLAFARTVIFDSALMFFSTAALAFFYVAITDHRLPTTGHKRYSAAAWAAMAFAMITKGPVIFVLVLFVVIPYAIYRKAAGALWSWLGFILFVAIIAPWVWAMSQVVPEFLRYVLVTETVERMATKALKRTGPPWYFIPYLIGGALPWSLVWLRGLKAKDQRILYLLLWIAIPFVFFSLNQSKRPQYILPLMPAIALLVAAYWETARTKVAAIVMTVLGVVFAIAPLLKPFKKLQPSLHAAAGEAAIGLAIAFLAGGLIALFAKRRDVVLAAFTLPILVIPIAASPLMTSLAERRSTKSFVAQLRPYVTPETEIVGIEAFTGSMAFYLRQPVTVVTEDASELTSNYLIRRYRQFTTNPASPLKPMPWLDGNLNICCAPRIYVVRNDDAAHRALLERRGMRLIATGAHHVAYGPWTGH